MKDKEEKKKEFIKAYMLSRGIISSACMQVRISRDTFYRWIKEDDDFRSEVEGIDIMQQEFVESKLLSKIDAGDTTAIIFYLKTKGKNLGYSEKANAVNATAKDESVNAGESNDAKMLEQKLPVITERIISTKARNAKQRLVNRLKKQGKYSPMLDPQIEIAANLLARGSVLMTQISSSEYSPIHVEYSREGNTRMSVNPMERLYLDVLEQTQKALRALGMNTDSKEVTKSEGSDKLVSLLEEVKSVGDN